MSPPISAAGPLMESLSGWGRCPVELCHVERPNNVRELQNVIVSGSQPNYAPRGLGRSYGDSSLNAGRGVVQQTRLDHFISFDERLGVLECESGVSLADVIRVCLPRGWFLPTTPGTKFVTVGGAIAADVHGKNHHVDGSFGAFVLDLRLMVASGEILTCSPTCHSDLFWATVGGMGLTGVIVSARFKLRAVETAYCDVTYRRTRDLDETLECFEREDVGYPYSVAWIDCVARGPQLGRSVVMLGRDALVSDLSDRRRSAPFHVPPKTGKSVPFDFPAGVLNGWTVGAFNDLFYAMHPDGRKVVDYDTYYYPLDAIHGWNKIYGRKGFVQYQVLFPTETSRQGLKELLERIAESQRASFLAVLKRSGTAGSGWLSYLFPGHTLALDFPDTGDDLRRLVRSWDEIVLRHGGRLYLAKDALMSRETFHAMYPNVARFQELKSRIDPGGRFSSSQARRVGLVEPS